MAPRKRLSDWILQSHHATLYRTTFISPFTPIIEQDGQACF
ncbi:MAG: hypothetical protein R3B83_15635 [Nitrospirales bacterium]